MVEIESLIQATLEAHIASDVQVISIEKQEEGPQGYSGAEIRYYDILYSQRDAVEKITLVIKEAALLERQTLHHLGKQGQSVPFSYTFDLNTDRAAPVCLQYLGESLPEQSQKQQVANALAAIHHANRGRLHELSWLPLADQSFIDQDLIQACWREAWESLLSGGEFVDGLGNRWGLPKPGGDFSADFSAYTEPIEKAAENFLDTMNQLWQEGDSLTLLHADFHNDHIRIVDERPYIIDWGSARYGSFYLDLPNYFSRDEVLLYRNALESLGHSIPQEKFFNYYDAVSAYPGFKYFGVGLANWCFGDPPHQREHVLHFINMILV